MSAEEIRADAMRIWREVPLDKWEHELMKLPVRKESYKVMWPWRFSVRERLESALRASRVGIEHTGFEAHLMHGVIDEAGS